MWLEGVPQESSAGNIFEIKGARIMKILVSDPLSEEGLKILREVKEFQVGKVSLSQSQFLSQML